MEGKTTGYLSQIWKLDVEPEDPTNGYTPYSFVPAGHAAPLNMSLGRDFARRESIVVVPGLDSVLDGYGRLPGPMDRRDMPFAFRRLTDGDNDAEWDRLMAWVAGDPVRLVYRTDGGADWFTVGSGPKIRNTEVSAGNWGYGGYLDFSITWRIRPDWWRRYSETVEVWSPADPAWSVDDSEVWSNAGTTAIASAAQNFALNATGTAGVDLPTLPDRAPKIYVVGPAGGDGGIGVSSFTARAYDQAGVRQPIFFTLPFKLPTANDWAALDFGAQTFWRTIGGVASTFRPYRPPYQPVYFRVEPGVVNNCVLTALGANPLTGGTVTVDWRKKRA